MNKFEDYLLNAVGADHFVRIATRQNGRLEIVVTPAGPGQGSQTFVLKEGTKEDETETEPKAKFRGQAPTV